MLTLPPLRPADPVFSSGLSNGSPAGSARHDLPGAAGSQEHQSTMPYVAGDAETVRAAAKAGWC
jgi:hypothetical protein